jgi:hypothetical protein
MELPEKHEVNQTHTISNEEFLAFASELKKCHPQMDFEIGTPDKRKTGYLFVQTDGTLFTHSPGGIGYRNLGTIYSPDWREQFFALNQSMLPDLSVSRYRVANK